MVDPRVIHKTMQASKVVINGVDKGPAMLTLWWEGQFTSQGHTYVVPQTCPYTVLLFAAYQYHKCAKDTITKLDSKTTLQSEGKRYVQSEHFNVIFDLMSYTYMSTIFAQAAIEAWVNIYIQNNHIKVPERASILKKIDKIVRHKNISLSRKDPRYARFDKLRLLRNGLIHYVDKADEKGWVFMSSNMMSLLSSEYALEAPEIARNFLSVFHNTLPEFLEESTYSEFVQDQPSKNPNS